MVHHRPSSVSVDHGLCALLVVWCHGFVMAGTASTVAGQQSDSGVAVSIASNAGVGGCRVTWYSIASIFKVALSTTDSVKCALHTSFLKKYWGWT